MTPPHNICLSFDPVFLVVHCTAPALSFPYGARHGTEHGRDAQIIPTEHTVGRGTGEMQPSHNESTSSEILVMAGELEPSGLHSLSNRHIHPMSRNKRKLRLLSDSILDEGNSLFNAYVSIQLFDDRCNNVFIMFICPFVHPWAARRQVQNLHFCQNVVLFVLKSIILTFFSVPVA